MLAHVRTCLTHAYLLVYRRTALQPYHGSDTDSTPEHRAVGGLGKYSHGVFNLVHQHWAQQLEMAGGFNVHNTEASEGYHKECMVLPCLRVRHYSTRNRTYDAMQKYLQRNLLFKHLTCDMGGEQPPEGDESTCNAMDAYLRRNELFNHLTRDMGLNEGHFYAARVCRTTKPLLLSGYSADDIAVTMGPNPERAENQRSILHPNVRIGRVELLNLMCTAFGIPHTRRSYALLGKLLWAFDQRLKMTDGTIYWATDDEYSPAANRRRRDIFLMKKSESVKVRLPCGQVVERDTAMCCQAMVFVTVSNITEIFGHPGPTGFKGDSCTFVLVRWLQAHPDATERNTRDLPLCPAPFNINHALWQYAATDRVRSLIYDSNHDRPTKHFEVYAPMFGKTREVQMQRLQAEKRAYFGLVYPHEIESIAHMCKEFQHNTTLESSTWLHTINM